MNTKYCKTFCFNDGQCTSCNLNEVLHETKCLGCNCPREWTGDRCEKRAKFLSNHLIDISRHTFGILIGLLIATLILMIFVCIAKHKVVKSLWIKFKVNYLCVKNDRQDLVSVPYATYTNDAAMDM
ncbi:unnamed protein product [Heterobilharzia americana]|nr:unnamed protein product [Heterobilharzia americana]